MSYENLLLGKTSNAKCGFSSATGNRSSLWVSSTMWPTLRCASPAYSSPATERHSSLVSFGEQSPTLPQSCPGRT
jgi:hypothetical protein